MFFSNGSRTSEGAYLDDIVVTGVGSAAMTPPLEARARAVPDEAPAAAEAAAARVLRAGPNPFPRGTALHFTLPRDGAARVTVYSVTGRRVAVLADGLLAAGRHRVAWNGDEQGGGRAAPGVYFARLELDGAPLAGERLVLMP